MTLDAPPAIAYMLAYDGEPESDADWALYRALLDALPPPCWGRCKGKRVFLVPTTCTAAVRALLPGLAGVEEQMEMEIAL